MNTLRWGIIGCGDVVEKKSGPSILAGERSRIIAVMRRDRQALEPFAEKAGATLRTTDPAAVINCPEVDIVYVATPPSTHKKYVLAAAAAGRHVLVEKPMGLNAAESREMVAACDRAGVQLFVAYYRRFQPHVLKMLELVKSGRIGKLVQGQVEFAQACPPGRDWGWRTRPEISGGGLFVDLLSHRIDLMVRFLGQPGRIQGTRSTLHPENQPEDLASILVQFNSGAQCSFSGNFATSKNIDRFVLTGTTGEIRTDHLDGQAFTLVEDGQAREFSFPPLAAPHLGLVRHIERVLAGEVENQSPGRHGALTEEILDRGLGRS